MLAKSFGIYAVELIKPISNHLLYTNLFAVGITIILAWLNMQTAADVGWVETFIVILKLSILIIIISSAYYQSNLQLAFISSKQIELALVIPAPSIKFTASPAKFSGFMLHTAVEPEML